VLHSTISGNPVSERKATLRNPIVAIRAKGRIENPAMNLLVFNSGSASQKCTLFAFGAVLPDQPQEPIWKGQIMNSGPDVPKGKLQLILQRGDEKSEPEYLDDSMPRTERLEHLLSRLWSGPMAALESPSHIDVTGHRVVHGGDYALPMRVDQKVEDEIQRLSAFAPLHNKSNLEGIKVAQRLIGAGKPHIAVFDTSFHRTLSKAAAIYPGPFDWIDQGIRRYGFHGTSFRWASHYAARLLGREDDPELRLIIAHLGGGCSLAATVGGKSIDTTMGFTPLDGIAMCSRSGAIDPGILFYLLRQGKGVDELEKILNKESGLAGLSGLPGDTRVILAEIKKGNEQARLSLDVFLHRLRAGLGQMLASLGDAPDALVFTDAIGEDEPTVRAAACSPFEFLGLKIDAKRNETSPLDAEISLSGSAPKVLIVKSREDWQIACECWEMTNESQQLCGSRH
jgi:acetate kinase